MNAKLVDQLARLETGNSSDLTEAAGAFGQIYTNPAFGWRIAKFFARAKKPFPLTMIGRNHWLFKAYLIQLDPASYRHSDVETAFEISQQPGLSAKLKALLITGLGHPIDAHLALVAEVTGIPRHTVEAFEILFFNVLDRHQDGLYLSNLAYPKERLVEFDEDYFETTPVGDLILRAAYNHRDINRILRLTGMTEEDCRKELTNLHDGEAKLAARIVGNALLIAKLGTLNQPSVGLQRATQLLASGRSRKSKPAEAKSQTPHDTAAELAAALAANPPLTDAERRDLKATLRPGQKVCSDEEGNVYTYSDTDDYSEVVGPAEPDEPTGPSIERFPEPIPAVWRNQDFDKPIMVIARMFEPGLPDHYLTDENSGVPAAEVFFENEAQRSVRSAP